MKLCKHGVPTSARHDCTYVDERDALIPQAEKYADDKSGPRPPFTDALSNPAYEEWAKRWNYYFHTRMDELWHSQRRECAA